jgi:hypothetical protein
MLSLATAMIAAVAFASGVLPARWIAPLESVFRRFAHRRFLCCFMLPALSFTVNALIVLHNGSFPTPKIHDEFSYLLAADTFAHGRLTNPAPPFPEHFETPQELVRPTRMSKYPPGQGIALMLGQVLTGEPLIGVWLSTAAAVAAIYWMLLAFVPPPWALLGGLVSASSPVLLDWSQNYWGGSVAVLGGALLLGAWGRLMIRGSSTAAIWLAIGLLVLANSRPYEGLVLSVPSIAGLISTRYRRGAALSPGPPFVPARSGDGHFELRRSRDVRNHPCRTVPELKVDRESGSRTPQLQTLMHRCGWLVAILLAGTAWMAFYNFRITGHPLRLPFMAYADQYDVYPKFWFQSLRPSPSYGNAAQRWVHTQFEHGAYDQLRTIPGFLHIAAQRSISWILGNLKLAVLLLPLLASCTLWRDLRVRWVFMIAGIFLLGLWAESFVLPHYTAPSTPFILLLVVIGWRQLSQWKCRGAATGRILAHSVGIGLVAGAAMSAAQGISPDSQVVDQQTLVAIEAPLQEGRHLIFVAYTAGHPFDNELVYNPADLDDSPIIWVHYFGPAADRAVADHFAGRQVWLLEAGSMLQLLPYRPGARGGISRLQWRYHSVANALASERKATAKTPGARRKTRSGSEARPTVVERKELEKRMLSNVCPSAVPPSTRFRTTRSHGKIRARNDETDPHPPRPLPFPLLHPRCPRRPAVGGCVGGAQHHIGSCRRQTHRCRGGGRA